MNKKKAALTLGAVSMVGAIAVGGTLAYLTNVTETKTNVFTAGNDDLGGKIVEDFDSGKAENFLPGDAIKKIPTLENDSDSIEAWVAVKVTITDTTYDPAQTISYDDFTYRYGKVTTAGADGFNTGDYEEITPEGVKNYKLFMYKDSLGAGESTSAIFDQVRVDAGIKSVISSDYHNKTVYKEVEAGTPDAVVMDGKYYVAIEASSSVDTSEKYYTVDANGKLKETDVAALPTFNIDVKGYMVQAQNVEKATAKAELIDLAQSK